MNACKRDQLKFEKLQSSGEPTKKSQIMKKMYCQIFLSFPGFCVKSKKFEMCCLCVSPHLSVRTNFLKRLFTFLHSPRDYHNVFLTFAQILSQCISYILTDILTMYLHTFPWPQKYADRQTNKERSTH